MLRFEGELSGDFGQSADARWICGQDQHVHGVRLPSRAVCHAEIQTLFTTSVLLEKSEQIERLFSAR
jgi:hypothetical protein